MSFSKTVKMQKLNSFAYNLQMNDIFCREWLADLKGTTALNIKTHS